ISRSDVVRAFWESPEHRGLQVEQLYATCLRKPADPTGRARWVGVFQDGADETAVARGILTSEAIEAARTGLGRAAMARHSPTSRVAAARLVDADYDTILGRAADPDGRALWVSRPTHRRAPRPLSPRRSWPPTNSWSRSAGPKHLKFLNT